jgi:hypothetical protein
VIDRPEQIRDRLKRSGWSLACYGAGPACIVEAFHERADILIHGRGRPTRRLGKTPPTKPASADCSTLTGNDRRGR